jgi:hypothetical protein
MSPFHAALTWGLFGLAALTFLALFVVTAPYGRHARSGWGPMLPSRVGWVLMELPAVALFSFVFALGRHGTELVPLVFLGLWLSHYLYRTFLFPLRMPRGERRMPLSIVAMGFSFNVWNGFVNARFVSDVGRYDEAWLAEPRFVAGGLLFVVGFVIHAHADARLLALKRRGEGYVIPRGGLFELVCQPNYFGELVEWCGFAIATWSLPGLAFAVYTFANLAPRALSHRRWYRERFADFPEKRRAIIPFVL